MLLWFSVEELPDDCSYPLRRKRVTLGPRPPSPWWTCALEQLVPCRMSVLRQLPSLYPPYDPGC